MKCELQSLQELLEYVEMEAQRRAKEILENEIWCGRRDSNPGVRWNQVVPSPAWQADVLDQARLRPHRLLIH